MKPIICKRCVLDTTVEDIKFSKESICNYCQEFLDQLNNENSLDSKQNKIKLENLIRRIKNKGKGKKYDCIVGLSGGVDSAWVMHNAIKFGLRPLAVHMDNGWNSELAQSNIENLVKTSGVDLYTHVIDWNEYRKLMQSFFDADVIDIELLYDNAMLAVNYQMAKKYNLNYILTGDNITTEGIRIPPNWHWMKLDKRNIYSIVGKHSKIKINTFPSIGILDYYSCGIFRKISRVPILNLLNYKKKDALDYLQKHYKFKPYPYKHYESIFTRFYQGYILPNKFNVDKRKLHFSTLIMTGQMTREKALEDLGKIPYRSELDLKEDKDYFLKKMNWSNNDLDIYIKRNPRSHLNYSSDKKIMNKLLNYFRKLSPNIRKKIKNILAPQA